MQALLCLLAFAAAPPATIDPDVLGAMKAKDTQISWDLQPKYDRDTPIIISADLSGIPPTASAAVKWELDGPAVGVKVNDSRTLHVWGKPGKYDLAFDVLAIDWQAQEFWWEELDGFVVIGDPIPPPPPPTLGISPAEVTEGQTASFTLTLSRPSTDTVTVMARTQDKTAKASEDYRTTYRQVGFPPGTVSTTFDVPTIDDSAKEQEEKFTVLLSEPVGATIDIGTADGTIIDDDAPPVTELFGIVLFETADLNDPKWAQVIHGRRLREIDNFNWQPFDDDVLDDEDQIPDDLKPWVALLRRDSLPMPRLFLVNQNGELLEHLLLPKTVDDVISVIRKYLP